MNSSFYSFYSFYSKMILQPSCQNIVTITFLPLFESNPLTKTKRKKNEKRKRSKTSIGRSCIVGFYREALIIARSLKCQFTTCKRCRYVRAHRLVNYSSNAPRYPHASIRNKALKSFIEILALVWRVWATVA